MFLLPYFTGAQTYSTVSTVRLVNVKNTDTDIPFLGEKVVIIFYVDPDVQRLTDPLSDALEEEKFPLDKTAFIGIANCKDTWIPNALIRMRARKQQERFPQSLILLDYDHQLAKAWDLGDCNNKVVTLIIGKDLKIKYLKVLKSSDESKLSVPAFLDAIRSELKK